MEHFFIYNFLFFDHFFSVCDHLFFSLINHLLPPHQTIKSFITYNHPVSLPTHLLPFIRNHSVPSFYCRDHHKVIKLLCFIEWLADHRKVAPITMFHRMVIRCEGKCSPFWGPDRAPNRLLNGAIKFMCKVKALYDCLQDSLL